MVWYRSADVICAGPNFGLEIDWNLVTGAPPGVLSAARKYAYCRTALFMVLRSICVRSFT